MNRRDKFKEGLCPLYLKYYELLCGELSPEWQPYCGYRTFDDQQKFYRQGRTISGAIVTNAKAGESPHNYGCGSDWTVWKNNIPVWMSKEDPRWDEYVNAVRKVGLRSGKEFGDIDHNELKISCSWVDVLDAFNRQGSVSAFKKIEESVVQ